MERRQFMGLLTGAAGLAAVASVAGVSAVDAGQVVRSAGMPDVIDRQNYRVPWVKPFADALNAEAGVVKVRSLERVDGDVWAINAFLLDADGRPFGWPGTAEMAIQRVEVVVPLSAPVAVPENHTLRDRWSGDREFIVLRRADWHRHVDEVAGGDAGLCEYDPSVFRR